MNPFYSDDWLTVWQGDCREVMAQMPAESVHTVVTSPPYGETTPANPAGALKAKKLGRDWIVTPAEVEKYRKEHRRS